MTSVNAGQARRSFSSALNAEFSALAIALSWSHPWAPPTRRPSRPPATDRRPLTGTLGGEFEVDFLGRPAHLHVPIALDRGSAFGDVAGLAQRFMALPDGECVVGVKQEG